MKIDFRWQIQQITEGFWKFLEGFDLVICVFFAYSSIPKMAHCLTTDQSQPNRPHA